MEQKFIKYVALYLRKSRGDVETDLIKHRNILTSLCKDNQWKYVEYVEVESGDSISMRPVMQKLLVDIENNIYDAVCVVDIDRLGRGSKTDQGKIEDVFIKTDTYIVTPQQIYNLKNDDDDFIIDMKTFIARREYKQIVKRLTQGKRVGSRMGMWTNGTPPYPYEYDRLNKQLIINQDKLIIYRHIVDSLLNGVTPQHIAWDLNKKNIPSLRSNIWHPNTVHRLLVDETHLGRIISNKTVGDAHVQKKPNSKEYKILPKSQWITVENCHEAVKTIEEHEKILLFLSRKTKAPRKVRKQILALSDLIKCGICGHTMSFLYRSDRKNPESLKPCWYKNDIGTKCDNEGMITNDIYDYIFNDLVTYKSQLQETIQSTDNNNNVKIIEDRMTVLNQELNNKQKALLRIQEAFENGVYSLEQFKDRKEVIEKAIDSLYSDLNLLSIELRQVDVESIDEKIKKIDTFFMQIRSESLSNIDKNRLYKSIIEKILWTKQGQEVTIEVVYK